MAFDSGDNIDAGGGWNPAGDNPGGDNIDAGGGWNPAGTPDTSWQQAGYGQQNYSAATPQLFGSTTDVAGDPAGDKSGFWGAIGKAFTPLLQYGIAKDAARNGMVQGYTPNGQPVYRPAPTLSRPVGQLSTGGLVLIAGAVALVLFASHGKA